MDRVRFNHKSTFPQRFRTREVVDAQTYRSFNPHQLFRGKIQAICTECRLANRCLLLQTSYEHSRPLNPTMFR